MEIKGTIHVIEGTKTYGAKGFAKRLFVVKTDEKYPQFIQMEFVQDKTTLLDKFKVGQEVTVNVNVRGREWTNPEGEAKYFLSLEAWRISTGEGVQAEPESLNPDPSDLPF